MNELEITQLIDAGLLTRRLIRRAEYDVILEFIRGEEPQAVAERMREVGRSELVLTPQHRVMPGRDTLELRISASGAISIHRRSQSMAGHRGIKIVDRETLEAAVPPEAVVSFAHALEDPQLWKRVNSHLEEKPGPPVAE